MTHGSLAYVSSYARPNPNASEPSSQPGVHVLAVDGASGALSVMQAMGSPNPTWIEPDPRNGMLWACYGPGRPRADCSIDAYRIAPDAGTLSGPDRTGIGPGSPAQLAVAPDGRFLVIANYGSGEFVVRRIDPGARLGEVTCAVRTQGSGPHPRQDGPHPHAVAFTPDGGYLVTADLGIDLIQVFRLDEHGVLHEVSRAATAAGSGPRHVAFSLGARTLYVIGELDGTITAFAFNPDQGMIGERSQSIATAPADHAGSQSAAEIALHPTGRFLYASNRGSQTIAAYRVDPHDGTLTILGFSHEGIAGPTNFAIAPDGQRLYVNSSEADRIVPFHIDAATGALTADGPSTKLHAPNVLSFIPS